MIRYKYLPQFITITNLNWLKILQNDHHKKIIIKFIDKRVELQEATVYGFITMPNHLHFIWQLHNGMNRTDFQRDFMKFTARSILNFMQMSESTMALAIKS